MSADFGAASWVKYSPVHRVFRPVLARSATRGHEAGGPAIVEVRTFFVVFQHTGDVESVGGDSAVVVNDGASFSHQRLQQVRERGVGRAPGAVVKEEIPAGASQLVHHRNQRRDANSSRKQQGPRCVRGQRKVVAGATHRNQTLHVQALVQCLRAAPTVPFAQDGDEVAMPFRGIVAQRVLPHAPVAEMEVDVRPGGERR